MKQANWTTMQYVLGGLAAFLAYGSVMLGKNLGRQFFLGFIPAIALALAAYFAYKKARHFKILAQLRDGWGKTKQPQRDPLKEDVRYFFDAAPKPEHAIDDRTWDDLNMDLIFTQIDRTFTFPGKQVLYQMLRIPCLESTTELNQRAAVIRHFEENQDIRERVQIALQRVGERLGNELAVLLWTPAGVEKSPYSLLYNLMFIAALLSPLSLFIGTQGIAPILAVFFINMSLHFSEQKRNKGHFESVKALSSLIRSAEQLCKTEAEWGPLAPVISDLQQALGRVRGFRRAASSITVESSEPTLAAATQYYAIFFLKEVRGFAKALAFITRERDAMHKIFQIMGTIDACQAAASYRCSLPYYCEPHFTEQRSFEVQDTYHPLVDDCVPNSIKPTKRGVLVTGSNMSGKSTFLRSIGISSLLAQTIYTVPAKSYSAPVMRLVTSIGRSDNVVEGKSYYLEEALAVRRVLEALEPRHTLFCIFDELFRGTNSEERIAAAYRVVKYIAERNSLVFTATHDLELTEMLDSVCENFHFSEKVSAVGLEFDYKLKPGPATTRNAIALLRFLGYPEDITDPPNSERFNKLL